MPTRNVVLTAHQSQLIAEWVAAGQYQNASEVLREGLRLVEQQKLEYRVRLDALRQAVNIGIADFEAGNFQTFDSAQALGERLREARLRRGFSAATVCARADISRPTLTKAEAGNAAVTLGTYLQVLRVLGLEQDLSLLAADDVVGRRLQDAQLPHRKRVARQPKEAA